MTTSFQTYLFAPESALTRPGQKSGILSRNNNPPRSRRKILNKIKEPYQYTYFHTQRSENVCVLSFLDAQEEAILVGLEVSDTNITLA